MQDLASFLIEDNKAGDDALALVDPMLGRSWTYGDMRALVERVSGELASPSKALVLLVLPNEAGTVVEFLGSLRAGHAVALIEPGVSAAALTTFVERYMPDWVIMPRSRATPLLPEYRPAPSRHNTWCQRWRRTDGAAGAIHSNLCLLLPTSGSTGSPKFVRLSHANLISNLKDIVQVLGISPCDRPITSLPVSHAFGLSVLNSHLRAGATIILTDKPITTDDFWSLVGRHRCTSFAGVPWSYRVLQRLDFGRLGVPTLTKMIQAGGRLEPELVSYFHSFASTRDGQFFVMYGQTEAAPRIATLASEDVPRKLESVGRAMPSGRLSIDFAGVDYGGVGEVRYSGPNVMLGYAHDRSDLSKGDECNGELATGDLGYLDSEGYLYLSGRIKRIAKVLGLRISLDDIEHHVASHGVAAAIESNGILVVYIECLAPTTCGGIRAELSRLLRVSMSLIRVVSIPELPRTHNDKTDYDRLCALADSVVGVPAPRTQSRPDH